MRNVLLTIHVLAAAGFIGGGVYSAVVFPGDVRSMGLRRVLRRDEALGNKFFGAVVGLLLLSGIWLVVDSDVFGFGDVFVWIGVGAIVLSGAAEAVFGPAMKRHAARGGDFTPDVSRTLRTDVAVHAAIFVVAVYAMVAKIGA